jgi:hypothetical protein
VPFRVFLGDAEVDVEQEDAACRRRLGPASVEDFAEPRRMDQLTVARELLDRVAIVGGPIGPAGLEAPESGDADRLQAVDQRARVGLVVAVDDGGRPRREVVRRG